jgi:hypothetical protein
MSREVRESEVRVLLVQERRRRMQREEGALTKHGSM